MLVRLVEIEKSAVFTPNSTIRSDSLKKSQTFGSVFTKMHKLTTMKRLKCSLPKYSQINMFIFLPYLKFKSRNRALKTSQDKRSYCQTCFKFVFSEQNDKQHHKHTILRNISEQAIKHPVLEFIEPIVSNSSNAVRVYIDMPNLCKKYFYLLKY